MPSPQLHCLPKTLRKPERMRVKHPTCSCQERARATLQLLHIKRLQETFPSTLLTFITTYSSEPLANARREAVRCSSLLQVFDGHSVTSRHVASFCRVICHGE